MNIKIGEVILRFRFVEFFFLMRVILNDGGNYIVKVVNFDINLFENIILK